MGEKHDVFRPRNEPALTLYDAFQNEAAKRSMRLPKEWVVKERHAVWAAARDYAQAHGLTVPTLQQVERAERYAMGSIDYGSKWAYGVAEVMRAAAEIGKSGSAASGQGGDR